MGLLSIRYTRAALRAGPQMVPNNRPTRGSKGCNRATHCWEDGKWGKAARQLCATSREVCLRVATSKTPCSKATVSTSASLNCGWAWGECRQWASRGWPLQELIHEVVDLGHVLVYAVVHRSPSLRERVEACTSMLIFPCWTDDLAVSTQD